MGSVSTPRHKLDEVLTSLAGAKLQRESLEATLQHKRDRERAQVQAAPEAQQQPATASAVRGGPLATPDL